MPLTTLSARWHASRRWVIERVPLPFLTNAHELALACALVVIGVALLVQGSRPGSVSEQVPSWMGVTWALAILLGGVGTVWGVFTNRVRVEWTGQIATGHGCAFYALAIHTSTTFRTGVVIELVFAVLAAVSWWRAFKLTMQPFIQERLAREATKAALRMRSENK